MANTLYPPPRPQSVGEILDSAFRIFRATLVQCLPYAIAAVIAGQLPNIYYLVSGRNMLQGLAGFRDPVWLTLYILGYVIPIVLWSAVLLRQYALSTGHPADTSSDLPTAVRRCPTVAFVLLMVLYLVSGLLAGLVSVLLAHGDIAVITAATTVFVVILSAVGTPFFWALALAVLGDLSVRKEGADLAQRLSSPAAS